MAVAWTRYMNVKQRCGISSSRLGEATVRSGYMVYMWFYRLRLCSYLNFSRFEFTCKFKIFGAAHFFWTAPSQVFVLRKLASIGFHIVLSIFFTERLICKFWERSVQNLGSNRRLRPPPLAIFSLGTPMEPISSAERYALNIINSGGCRQVFSENLNINRF